MKRGKLDLLVLIACSLLLIFSSSWFLKIVSYNTFLGILMVLLSLGLCYVVFSKQKIVWMLFFLGYSVATFVIVSRFFDTTIFTTDRLEKMQLDERGRYMGKLDFNFNSEWLLPFYKIEKNFFYLLDLNQYFFAGHPRERGDAYEFEKFNFFFMSLFLLGIWRVVKLRYFELLVLAFSQILFSSLISPGGEIGVLPVLPILVVVMALGLSFLITLVYLKFKKR